MIVHLRCQELYPASLPGAAFRGKTSAKKNKIKMAQVIQTRTRNVCDGVH